MRHTTIVTSLLSVITIAAFAAHATADKRAGRARPPNALQQQASQLRQARQASEGRLAQRRSFLLRARGTVQGVARVLAQLEGTGEYTPSHQPLAVIGRNAEGQRLALTSKGEMVIVERAPGKSFFAPSDSPAGHLYLKGPGLSQEAMAKKLESWRSGGLPVGDIIGGHREHL
jgi:hypothetical protein